MLRGAALAVCALGALLTTALPGQAQPARVTLDARLVPPATQSAATSPAPAIAMSASALLPGAGQYLLGSERWVPYIAVELWAWLTWANRRRDGKRLEREYRDLAWSVPRRAGSGGLRRDTVFEYYESMAYFASSGSFDADPQLGGIQPETDPTTYNGDQWALARSLYFPGGVPFPPGSPEYTRAFQYYLAHAIPASYAWAWGASNLEQQIFRELIAASDGAFRTSRQMLGLILANHFVSAVDALVLARLRRRAEGGTSGGVPLELESGMEPGPLGPRLALTARVRW